MELSKEKLDSQPLTSAFSFDKEKAKSMHGLRGILTGIVADQRLNEIELLYLDAWLKSQHHLEKEEDVVSILTAVGEVLEDGKISMENLARMRKLIEDIVSGYESTAELERVNRVDQLVGFLTGIASDNVLNDEEISALDQWLNSNESIRDAWPASVVVDRIANILEDGIITDEEREDLLGTVNKITGADPDGTGISYESSTEAWEDPVEELKIAGSTFCLSGEFVSGDRETVDTLLRCLGADTQPNVNSHVDYLVIGTLASRDWLYTSHGRKIEKALLLRREEGHKITIITERTLLRFTRNSALKAQPAISSGSTQEVE